MVAWWRHNTCALLLEIRQYEGFQLEGNIGLCIRAWKIFTRIFLLLITLFLLLFSVVEVVCEFGLSWLLGLWQRASLQSITYLQFRGRGPFLTLSSSNVCYFFLEWEKNKYVEGLFWKIQININTQVWVYAGFSSMVAELCIDSDLSADMYQLHIVI